MATDHGRDRQRAKEAPACEFGLQTHETLVEPWWLLHDLDMGGGRAAGFSGSWNMVVQFCHISRRGFCVVCAVYGMCWQIRLTIFEISTRSFNDIRGCR